MLLSEMQINRFLDVLGSNEPAPGGGSASALAGAVGIALGSMVASLTVGKEKYREHEALMQEIMDQAHTLVKEFNDLIDKDTEAFNHVADVFKMPKETDDDKAKRKTALEEALKNAALVPFSMMEKALESLRLLEKALGKSSANAVSDLGVGALNLKTALLGAWLNVLINLSGIKNEEFVHNLRVNGSNIVTEATAIADRVYKEVVGSLGGFN